MPSPISVTLAAYAHRGAYPLIATALLAGVFVLVTLRPGSDTAAVPLIRRLVVLWVGQNVFLVASSILRTLDYVDAYSLTRLRVAALLWMALVAVGLSLILWRMLSGKSATWLINANALAGAGEEVVRFTQDEYDERGLTGSEQFGWLSLTQQTQLKACYQWCNPRPMTDLLNNDETPIAVGTITFTCTCEDLFGGIVETIYRMRNMLLHGELKPHDAALACYQPAYHLLRQMLRECR